MHYVNSQGAEHVINWELASTPECRQLISKFKQIEEYLKPPFMVESMPKASKSSAKPPKRRRRGRGRDEPRQKQE